MKLKHVIAASLLLVFASCSKEQHISIQTTKVSIGEITETVTATGTLESVTQVDVGTQVTGIIDKLYADYNSEVKKGELIAEIEKTLLDADLQSADANLESARLTYEYNLANYKRDKALHDKQLISDLDFETTKKDYQVSKTAYDKAKADRVRAAKNLNYAEIYSPIDGVVISREVEVGQTVVSNMNVANLYTIADLDNMQVVGNVDEADIGKVKVGQSVTFTVDAYSDDIFEGTITQVRLNPTTESNVVTYEVIVAASNPEHKLIPGLTANLTIYITREQNVLTIDNKALTFEPQDQPEDVDVARPEDGVKIPETTESDQRVVWVVDGNKLVPTVIKLGATNGMCTEILSGLKEGQLVAMDYNTEAEKDSDTESSSETSPFAPQPPGKKK